MQCLHERGRRISGLGELSLDEKTEKRIGLHCIITTTGGEGTHCSHSQVKYFVLQMPSGNLCFLHLSRRGKKCFSYFREQTKIYPIMSVMHQIPCVAMNLVFPLKPEGDTVNIFNKATTRAIWRTFTLSQVWLPSRLVFQTSKLLRTNQKLNFTNVTLSRLRGGCGDNEGLQGCETDRLKWIIRTESFCDCNDTLREIGSLSSIWNLCAVYLYDPPRPNSFVSLQLFFSLHPSLA